MVGRRPRERSVGLRDPNFLRRAARGGPGRSAGQNRKRGARSETLRDPLTLPAAAAINQEMMPRQHTWRTPHLGTCSRGWSDGPARRWWVVGQGGRTGEGDLGGGVVRQDVIRVQVPGGQTRAARRRAGEAEVHSTRQRRRQHRLVHGDNRTQRRRAVPTAKEAPRSTAKAGVW